MKKGTCTLNKQSRARTMARRIVAASEGGIELLAALDKTDLIERHTKEYWEKQEKRNHATEPTTR